ncbi:rRNA maturation RNase YbeY [Pustulibacterium marinum]|uniref:Endoribonuclease YbeY n=1 Tax=Pustulibacterium marinum TaxID=1224947 RepID=A0A1I7ETK0_9FLAO|nr:rRNA maturation RNase YbeY [Pustulibacterium marinum]SFU27202.1 rRNA maturation RNase YbeY [Pustulibacterium marinum]
MINFHYETEFELSNEADYGKWIASILSSEDKELGELNYIFCNDEYLHKINVDYLDHDTLTDIISFDYTEGDVVSGDIFISIERVEDNAKYFNVMFHVELLRVMSHGVLHYCGYKDKSDADADLMRSKEEEKIKLFHVKQ